MTLPRLYAMNEYWQDHPPVHISVAAFIGIKPREKHTDVKIDIEQFPEYEE